MKFSTRARYGLRMMVELARLRHDQPLVNLSQISKITGLSKNYLGQLAIPLKDDGLLIGIPGKKGGYQLARDPKEIPLIGIIKAVGGPMYATECVNNPHLCLNAESCETRMIWALLTHAMQDILAKYTLADLIDSGWRSRIKKRYPELRFVHPERMIKEFVSGRRMVSLSIACQKVKPSTKRG